MRGDSRICRGVAAVPHRTGRWIYFVRCPDVIQNHHGTTWRLVEFKRFLASLTAHAIRSPVAILASTITFVGMFPYWYFYGFNNRWFSVGLILWIITSSISKQMTLPIYSGQGALLAGDFPRTKRETRN